MPDAIAVTGVGLISALGYDVATSCAAARAGISRAGELDFTLLDEEALEMTPVIGHSVKGVTDGFSGPGRLIRLGAAALGDLVRNAALPAGWGKNAAILACVPDRFYLKADYIRQLDRLGADSYVKSEALQALEDGLSTYRRKVEQSLIPRILEQCQVVIPQRSHWCFFGGQAEYADLLRKAISLLETKVVDHCIVGGIDSLVEPQLLEALHSLGLLKFSSAPTGILPGEAAAFAILRRLDTAKNCGAEVDAILGPSTVARETTHRFSGVPATGQSIAAAAIEACQTFQPDHGGVGLVIGFLNGDAYRAVDYGHALVRLAARGYAADSVHWHPAFSFGETGAAGGAVALCVGVRGFARRYAMTRNIMVLLSSDNGTRATFFLRDPH